MISLFSSCLGYIENVQAATVLFDCVQEADKPRCFN